MIAAAMLLPGALPARAQTVCAIERPEKIGVGVVATQGAEQLERDLGTLGARWFYDWQLGPSIPRPDHVPMVWSSQTADEASNAPGDTLLTFNEPDNPGQAEMTPEEAIAHWPELMATGKRLGSPAVQTGNETGYGRWLTRFMAEAQARGYRVDFIAVHYYSTSASVDAFRRHLEAIHEAYGRPVWVTEWALADWSYQDRFPAAKQRAFFEDATEMMDDLPFVERHAWFGIYDGLDNWDLNTGLIEDGHLTPVGEGFTGKVNC